MSSVAVTAEGAIEEPSSTAASVGAMPSSGSWSRQATLGSVAAATAAFLRLQGIQKQHLLSSVSSPVIGSTLFTDRQQKTLRKHMPHLLWCFGWWLDVYWCIGSTLILVCFSSTISVDFGFLRQLLQQLDVGQQRDFFFVSSTISSCVVVEALLRLLASTGCCSSAASCRRSLRNPQQRMQRERRNRMQSVVQQRQQPALPTSSFRNSWLPVLKVKKWRIHWVSRQYKGYRVSYSN